MKYVFAILLLSVTCFGQQRDECDHVTNSKKRFENVRITPPVRIRAWNGKTLEVTYEDRVGVYAESFEGDEDSVIEFKKYEKKWFWVMYCLKDKHIYVVTEVAPKQMEKKK